MTRFDPQGQTRLYWVTSALTIAAPTAAQILAGTRLDEHVVPDSVAGFTAEGQDTDVTDLAATREETVPGLATVTPGEITFFRGDTPADPEDVLFGDLQADYVSRAAGFVVVVLKGAPVAGGLVDIHPSIIKSFNADTPKGGTGARWMVGFSHPAASALNIAVAS